MSEHADAAMEAGFELVHLGEWRDSDASPVELLPVRWTHG